MTCVSLIKAGKPIVNEAFALEKAANRPQVKLTRS
ncbi:hypothetical protein N783_19825 [Pontibacillus marinus BH030004 = DSM 16465]|uniref:Uncharacterized protein n=1 Tax=Pontibacillus marinus BH030004 = DSM 16465 TaxID=1385511 RepID=A0A0A5GF44_9BACI|nr:hypothetical protein N783_19825 [Pontibacillus marinus BH030004 = DSM 16465]